MRLLWLRFMREINNRTRDVASDLLAVPEISEAIELAQESAYTPAELNAYESYWDAVSTEKTLMAGKYREGHAEGRVEGHAEGHAEGRAEGHAEGLSKGREEGVLEVAKRLKAEGVSSSTISACTGLSSDVINRL